MSSEPEFAVPVSDVASGVKRTASTMTASTKRIVMEKKEKERKARGEPKVPSSAKKAKKFVRNLSSELDKEGIISPTSPTFDDPSDDSDANKENISSQVPRSGQVPVPIQEGAGTAVEHAPPRTPEPLLEDTPELQEEACTKPEEEAKAGDDSKPDEAESSQQEVVPCTQKIEDDA